VHLNHWWLVVGSGKPTQAPDETARLLPVALLPETVGFVVADGVLVTMEVDAVNLAVEVPELVAVILVIRCFPRSSLVSTKLLVVAPLIGEHPTAAVSAGAVTELSHLNH
jgi:hypothetical protein